MDEKIIEKWLTISSGSGSGSGSGDGSGSGYGDGSGSGYGDGYGDGIKYYNKHKVFKVDDIQTIITSIKGNIAKGFILLEDLTLERTYVAKGNNYFAHGETIKEALQSLEEKIFSDMDYDEKIEEFKNIFNKQDKYKGTEFFKWHNLLTGSCLQGRKAFVSNKELDLEKEYSVKEFLKIVKGAYGWSMLEKLEKENI